MITCTNIVKYPDLDFESYIKLPGYSFSYLKREVSGVAAPVQSTPKIELGKLVDAILTQDKEVDMGSKLYATARDIAAFLKDKFGYALPHFEKQVSYTGTLTYRGFSIPFKGRPDFEFYPHFIVDLKVTAAKNIQDVCNFMRYEDQVFGYAKLARVPLAYLLVYSVPLKAHKLISNRVKDTNAFFEDKILKFGSVNATY